MLKNFEEDLKRRTCMFSDNQQRRFLPPFWSLFREKSYPHAFEKNFLSSTKSGIPFQNIRAPKVPFLEKLKQKLYFLDTILFENKDLKQFFANIGGGKSRYIPLGAHWGGSIASWTVRSPSLSPSRTTISTRA